MDLRVKVVPAAKKTEIVGWLGDRLKVRVNAPPEGGKANRVLLDLLQQTLGAQTAEVIAGHHSREKVVRLTGIAPEVLEKLGR